MQSNPPRKRNTEEKNKGKIKTKDIQMNNKEEKQNIILNDNKSKKQNDIKYIKIKKSQNYNIDGILLSSSSHKSIYSNSSLIHNPLEENKSNIDSKSSLRKINGMQLYERNLIPQDNKIMNFKQNNDKETDIKKIKEKKKQKIFKLIKKKKNKILF